MSYSVSVVIEKDENGYYAYAPELPGCQSQGESLEDEPLRENHGEPQEVISTMVMASDNNKIKRESTHIQIIELKMIITHDRST